MEYNFILNSYHQPVAEFSMGHEAIGRWFTEELGKNRQRIADLLACIHQLEHHQLYQKEYLGSDFTLLLNDNEIEVTALVLDYDPTDELPEGTELYDNEAYSGCGLEDFKQALLAWQEFVGR